MFGKKNKAAGNQSVPEVDYSNIMPGAMADANLDLDAEGSASTQEMSLSQGAQVEGGAVAVADENQVVLPEEAYAIAEKRGNVARPVKNYRYTIINSMGKKENGTFDAENENDVRNFLLAQDYQVLSVAERSKYDIDIGGNGKIKAADLAFSLTQLSTYIRSGIPLADSVRILAKQTKRPNLKKSFNQLVYELLKGESLSSAMELQETVYPKLLINMVKTAEMTGDLPSILDDMA